MIDVELPSSDAATPVARGFAACLASVTEVPVADVPLAAGGLDHTLGAARTWLAGRGAGLVPVADPTAFQWAGWWVAVTQAAGGPAAVLAFGTPPGVVLSPQDATLLGRATADLPITDAWAVASLDPVLRDPRPVPDVHGAVAELAVAPVAEAPMQRVVTATALAGRGLAGDRYAEGAGTFTPRGGHRPGYDLTLVAAEALDELTAAGYPVDLSATRRNVLTRGVDLDSLVGRTFRIGPVLLAGRRRCEPCVHLDRVTGLALLRPLIHRGGLRVDVLTDGVISVGDAIEPA